MIKVRSLLQQSYVLCISSASYILRNTLKLEAYICSIHCDFFGMLNHCHIEALVRNLGVMCVSLPDVESFHLQNLKS
jgi:hypothetical protein